MTTTSAAPCPLHPWIAQPCNICTTTFSVAPAQGEPHDYDALIARVRERILPTHGGTAPAMSHWNLTSGDSLLHRDAADALTALRAELERERVRLAACGVAAMQNTRTSAKDRMPPDAWAWSASYSDVCRAVDNEMNERERAERAEAERDALRADAARYRWLRGGAPAHSERWSRWNLQRWDGRSWHSLERTALDAAIDAAMKGDGDA